MTNGYHCIKHPEITCESRTSRVTVSLPIQAVSLLSPIWCMPIRQFTGGTEKRNVYTTIPESLPYSNNLQNLV